MKRRYRTFSSAFCNRMVWICLQKKQTERKLCRKVCMDFSVLELGRCYPCSPFIYKVTFLEILANGSLELKLAHISKFIFSKVLTSAYMLSHMHILWRGYIFNKLNKKNPCQTVHKVCLQNDCTNSCSVHAIWLKVQSQGPCFSHTNCWLESVNSLSESAWP